MVRSVNSRSADARIMPAAALTSELSASPGTNTCTRSSNFAFFPSSLHIQKRLDQKNAWRVAEHAQTWCRDGKGNFAPRKPSNRPSARWKALVLCSRERLRPGGARCVTSVLLLPLARSGPCSAASAASSPPCPAPGCCDLAASGSTVKGPAARTRPDEGEQGCCRRSFEPHEHRAQAVLTMHARRGVMHMCMLFCWPGEGVKWHAGGTPTARARWQGGVACGSA